MKREDKFVNKCKTALPTGQFHLDKRNKINHVRRSKAVEFVQFSWYN